MTETLHEQTWTQEGRPHLRRRNLPIPDGPWVEEPDKAHWIDPETDMDCLAVRNGMGAWCGYVAVTEGHPLFGIAYSSCPKDCGEDYCYQHSPEGKFDVHGGLTFSDFCHEDERGEGYGICHTPLAGRPERVWWFGFDCNHAGDMSPYDAAQAEEHDSAYPWPLIPGDVYRDLAYVKRECTSLAQQLAKEK